MILRIGAEKNTIKLVQPAAEHETAAYLKTRSLIPWGWQRAGLFKGTG